MKEKEAEQREAEREQRVKALLNSFIALSNTGEEELAQQTEQKLLKGIRFVERKDWTNHMMCGDFESGIDIRCIAFCCCVSKTCVYRHLVLKKLGKTEEDYKQLKERLAEYVVRWVNE